MNHCSLSRTWYLTKSSFSQYYFEIRIGTFSNEIIVIWKNAGSRGSVWKCLLRCSSLMHIIHLPFNFVQLTIWFLLMLLALQNAYCCLLNLLCGTSFSVCFALGTCNWYFILHGQIVLQSAACCLLSAVWNMIFQFALLLGRVIVISFYIFNWSCKMLLVVFRFMPFQLALP